MALPTVVVTPGSGQTINTLPNAGQATMANSLPVVIASDQGAVPVSAASLPLPAGAATSALQTALNTAIGSPMQSTGGTVGLVAGTALAGDVGLQLRAANGLSTSYTSCGNSNNATVVKASAGSVAGIRVFNNSGSIAYLKLYNKATTPSPASDTVFDKILIPANTNGAGVAINMPYAQAFATGIAFAVIAGFGDTDNTSIAANAFSVTILYK